MNPRDLSKGMALFALMSGAACGAGTPAQDQTSSGAGGTTGSSNNASSAAHGPSAVAVTSATTGTGSGGGTTSGGGGAMPCDPAPDPGSFWAQTATDYASVNPVSMCAYTGDVVLVVNTAAL